MGHGAPVLSPAIHQSFHHPLVYPLMVRTLAEDLATFGIPHPTVLAHKTFDALRTAGAQYSDAARQLALEVYPRWYNVNVRDRYHDYNWHVERAGSAALAAPYMRGPCHVDLGGGPGTFALELLARLRNQAHYVTIADIADARNTDARHHAQIAFHPLAIGDPLPFADKQFDCGALLYVLHHVETDHEVFLRECARCIRNCLILFEDVKVDVANGLPHRAYRPARPLEADFLQLPLGAQEQFIAGIDYVCNHIASQALTMPVPGKYYEFSALAVVLQQLFPSARVTKHFHGIYDQKCYPNPEAMYVVEFAQG